jgi:predicted secreted Zn-dependent protease
MRAGHKMYRSLWLHELLWLLAILSATTTAKPTVTEKYVYYLVSPGTLEELPAALNNTSPLRENNQIYHGYTETKVNWKFWWFSENHSCWIDKVETTVVVTYTLPQLTTSYPEVNKIWGKWYPNLMRHELHHKDLAIRIANDIEKAFYDMEARTSCEQLERDANNIGNQFISKLKKLNDQYDKDTKHGETEGANIRHHLQDAGYH